MDLFVAWLAFETLSCILKRFIYTYFLAERFITSLNTDKYIIIF